MIKIKVRKPEMIGRLKMVKLIREGNITIPYNDWRHADIRYVMKIGSRLIACCIIKMKDGKRGMLKFWFADECMEEGYGYLIIEEALRDAEKEYGDVVIEVHRVGDKYRDMLKHLGFSPKNMKYVIHL